MAEQLYAGFNGEVHIEDDAIVMIRKMMFRGKVKIENRIPLTEISGVRWSRQPR